jgi:hypothetical protein
MPQVGFETTIPVFKRPKVVRASDRSADFKIISSRVKEIWLKGIIYPQFYSACKSKGKVLPVF